MVYESFVAYMLSLMHYNMLHGIDVTFSRAIHGSQAHARNELVKKMDGDWLLFLDTDMVFEPDIFEKMHKIATENNIEVLSGIYYQRQPPHIPVVYKIVDGQFFSWDPFQFEESLLPTDGAGAGYLLIKKTVFERIEKELQEEPFSIISPNSEDYSFFLRLKKLGIQPYITKDVMCGHTATQIIGKDNFQISKANLP